MTRPLSTQYQSRAVAARLPASGIRALAGYLVFASAFGFTAALVFGLIV